MTDLIKGCDISSVQGADIDFVAVKASGLNFIIAKCGNGNDGIDPTYAYNFTSSQSAGLYAGSYHFLYPLPPRQGNPLRDPAAQAQYHFRASQGAKVVFVDLEWPAPRDFATWGCSASQIARWLLTYLQAYEKLSGVRPIIYTYPDYAEVLNLPASFGTDYQLWIASYETTPEVPAPWTDWIVWQASGGTEKLPNGTPVDIDYVRDLSLWQASATVVQSAPISPVPPSQPTIISPPTLAPISPVVPQVSDPSVSFWQSLLNFFGL